MSRRITGILSRKAIVLVASTLLIACVAIGAFAFQSTQVTHAATYCPPEVGYGSYDGWGAQSGPVHLLQQTLNARENAGLSVDGNFGSLTRTAVVNWQSQAFPGQSGEWDGIVGPHTWASLGYCVAGPRPLL